MTKFPVLQRMALMLVLLFTVACGNQEGGNPTNEARSNSESPIAEEAKKLNNAALALMREDGDPQALQEALEKLNRAIELAPEAQPLRATRLTVLLELQRYPEAIEEIEDLITLTGYQQHGLMLCMVKEVYQQASDAVQEDCYAAVAQKLLEEQGEAIYEDVNYVLTLKMAKSEDFPAAAERFLKSRDSNVEREFYEEMLLEQSRDQILSDMFHDSAKG